MSALHRPHREIAKAREGLGDQSRYRQGAWKVGGWRLLAFPDNLTSVNWLYRPAHRTLRLTPPAVQASSPRGNKWIFWALQNTWLLNKLYPPPVPFFSCKHHEPQQNCHSHKDWRRSRNWVVWLVQNQPEKNSPSDPKSGKSCQHRTAYTTVDQLLLKTL